jgi:hypothetical protein
MKMTTQKTTIQILWRGLGIFVLGSFCLLTGCGKSNSIPAADPNAGLPAEAIAVRKAFESASPSYRNPIEEVLALVRAGQINPSALAEALPQLERIASNPTISAEQKQALDELIQKIKSSGVKTAPARDVR